MEETFFNPPDFRNQNEVSRYPFADTASRLTNEDGLELGADIFVDASFYPVGGDERLYISSIVVAPREVTIFVGSAEFPQLLSTTFDPYDDELTVLPFGDQYGRDGGILVTTPELIRTFASWPTGTHTFERDAAEFVASCNIPTPEIGLRGIIAEDGGLLQGDIWIVGDYGVVVRPEDDAIRVDVVGDPLFLRRLCSPLDKFRQTQFLLTINDCGPDAYGNFNLLVDDGATEKTILRIRTEGDAIKVELIGRKIQG